MKGKKRATYNGLAYVDGSVDVWLVVVIWTDETILIDCEGPAQEDDQMLMGPVLKVCRRLDTRIVRDRGDGGLGSPRRGLRNLRRGLTLTWIWHGEAEAAARGSATARIASVCALTLRRVAAARTGSRVFAARVVDAARRVLTTARRFVVSGRHLENV